MAATLEELKLQEANLKQKLESTKKIDERRRIRKELRDIKEQKEKFLDENGNEKPPPSVASKFVMRVGSSTRRDEPDSGKYHRDRSPARKENFEPEKPKSTRSTFSFKLASSEEQEKDEPTPSYSRRSQRNTEKCPSEELSHRRTQPKREEAPGEERRSRRNRELNNDGEGSGPRVARKQQPEPAAQAPKRMTRRASLAELFKIDQEGRKPRTAPTQKAPEPAVSVQTTQKRMYAETHQDTQTKHGLIQSLTKLRSRRRSVREIERKEELEGLMYVKTGDSVKLISTSKGDQEVKEQRRVRRNSRKESHEKLVIDNRTVAEKDDLPAIEESPRSPAAKKSFTFEKKEETVTTVNTVTANGPFGPRAAERPRGNGAWQPAPSERPGPKIWAPPRLHEPVNSRQPVSKPGSFLPERKPEATTVEKPSFGKGSVKDRMAFFRQAAEEEKNAKAAQYKPKIPPSAPPSGPARTPVSSPSPASAVPPGVAASPPSPRDGSKERVSLKKAPDPARQPRELKKKPALKRQMSVSSMILEWCKDVTRDYKGVTIKNFSGSFANGLAFCALIHKFNPEIYNFDELDPENKRYNFELAFNSLKLPSVNVPCLLDVEDMVRLSKPEPRSVQCQVQMIFSKYRPKDLDMSNLVIA